MKLYLSKESEKTTQVRQGQTLVWKFYMNHKVTMTLDSVLWEI